MNEGGAGYRSSSAVVGVAVGFLGFGFLWWATSTAGRVDPLILPAPGRVVSAFAGALRDGPLGRDLWVTTWRALLALGLSVVLGVGAGLWLGLRPRIYFFVSGLVQAMRSVPAIAFFPCGLLLIGTDWKSIVALGVFSAFSVMLLGTVSGVALANPYRMRQMRRLGMHGWKLAFQVALFEAMPTILAALRIAAAYCLSVVVALEMFLGVVNDGLGRRLYEHQNQFQTELTFAYMMAAGLLGLALSAGIALSSRWLLRWLPHAANEHAP